jgi:transposase
MREGTVRNWCRMFKDGRKNVHDEERSGRPSVVSDDLVESVEQKISE